MTWPGGWSMRSRWRELELAAPILAYFGVTFLLWAVARAVGAPFLHSATWAHWDSGLYLDIARNGYDLVRCAAPATGWCGDAGWFPGYPLAVAGLHLLGVPLYTGGVVISWCFAFAALLLVWVAFLRRLPTPARYLGLLFAACDPGGIYFRATFPMSLTAFAIVLCLALLERCRWAAAGVAGALAAFCYPTAVAIVVVIVAWALAAPAAGSPARRAATAALSGGIALSGFAGAIALEWAQTGRARAYFLVQDKYHHGVHPPTAALWREIRGAFRGSVTGTTAVQDIEALVVTMICLGLLAAVIVRMRRRQSDRFEPVLMLAVLLFWLVPLTQANVSWWRSDALLLPAAVLVGRMRPPVAACMAAGVVIMLPMLAYFFFDNTLV